MKTCSKCKTEKPRSEFWKNAQNKDGLDFHCKECKRIYAIQNRERIKSRHADWCAANSEKVRASAAAWRAANREKCRALHSEWLAANPDKMRTAQAAYRAANRDKRHAANAAWHAANPDANRIRNQNRRARERSSGKLSKGLSARLFKLQRGKCACGCKQPLGEDFHLDHIMPIALGGSNTDDNIQLLRAMCNVNKSAKHPVDFMQQRGFLI